MSLGLAVLGSGALGAGASIFGASQSAKAAREAARAQQAMYDQQRADLAPWREAGASALTRLAGTVDTPFQTSPGYQFAFDEGMRAVQDSAAARGRLNSGATWQALNRYGQGVANQEFGNWQNRLAALAGVGQSATTQTGAFGANAANAMGAANMAAGNAIGGGAINAANAINGGVNNLATLYALNGGWGGMF